MEATEQKFSTLTQNIPLYSALIGMLLAFACTFSPIFYATYTPVKAVPANAPPVVFFYGKFPSGLAENCSLVQFELVNSASEGTYQLLDIVQLLQRIPTPLAALALLNIVAMKQISKLKFLIAALLFLAVVVGLLLFYSNRTFDCTAISYINITSMKIYEPIIIFWIGSLALSFFTLRSVHKMKQKGT